MGKKESPVETYLTERVEALGGTCEKFVTPGKVGPPDRIISWKHGLTGIIDFAETKSKDGVLESWQERDHKRRRAMGFLVVVLWDEAGVDEYIRCYCPPNVVSGIRRIWDPHRWYKRH
jgi:hypothetical protein